MFGLKGQFNEQFNFTEDQYLVGLEATTSYKMGVILYKPTGCSQEQSSQ